jgi:tetratricopeptide (TPR) repeat protein
MSHRGPLALIAILLLGCNGGRGHATQSDDGSDPAKLDPPAQPSLRPSAFVRPPADVRTQLHAQLIAHVQTGRAALASGDMQRAATALEQAAKLDPLAIQTLSELGTAYFELGRFADAERVRSTALHFAGPAPSERAALLFRLGNAVELGGDRQWASELYTRSLELAPAPEVSDALVGLTGGVEVVGHVHCGWTKHGEPQAQPCRSYLRLNGWEATHRCAYDPPAGDALELGDGRRVFVFSYLEPSGERELLVANVIAVGQWFSAPLAWIAHPSATHVDENLATLELRAEDLARGGMPEVVIEWEVEGRGLALEQQREHSWRVRDQAVLHAAGHEPRWLLGVRLHASQQTGPIDGPLAPAREASVALKIEPKTGELEVVRTEHEPSARLGEFALGSYPLLCPIEIGAS